MTGKEAKRLLLYWIVGFIWGYMVAAVREYVWYFDKIREHGIHLPWHWWRAI